MQLDPGLPNRQVVRVGSNISSPLTHNTGAPQGCVLSPLLYSLYTHDCVATHSSNVIVKFADDTTVVGLITDDDELAYREEVHTLTNWCHNNNISNTKELMVDSGDGPVSTPTSPSTGLQWSGSTAVAEISPRTSPGLLTHSPPVSLLSQATEEIRSELKNPQTVALWRAS